MQTARELAIEAFYADRHPLMEAFAKARGLNEDADYGCDLSEVIAFAEAMPPADLAETCQ